MSLVAYGSSDESSDDDGNNYDEESEKRSVPDITQQRTNEKLHLPIPKHDTLAKEINDNVTESETNKENDKHAKIHFDRLPKPKTLITDEEGIVEEDDILSQKEIELKFEKSMKKDRIPVKITVPSLSQFKDVEEDNMKKPNRIKPSNKGTKLFALLPPPKGSQMKKATYNLIPNTVNKTITKSVVSKNSNVNDSRLKNATKSTVTKSSIGINYDSNSEDEEESISNGNSKSTTDFFSLAATADMSVSPDAIDTNINIDTITAELKKDVKNDTDIQKHVFHSSDSNETVSNNVSQKTLTSNVMDLPKEEILLKNKAEVGPKLPVPEQEYNVDLEGNVAFDEKAIEYLCGKRGVKRKNKEVEEANIIEINGEDIKPDEREWLVKALTEEPVQRPISMQGGVNSQSKKKHQITYLAHQAKAMEMELKNQWAQNRLTRKQTQSKYGF